MRHIWQWLCGYICVSIHGRQVNRFLNLCSRNGIHLWRIRYYLEHEIHAYLKFRDFYELKPYLRKTKTHLKIISKKGFPFWCYRHPKLKWFLCICVFGLCIAIYSLNFIWNIEIKGNNKLTSEEILSCLHACNVSVGQKKEHIDCSGIEVILREHFDELGWVSVYFDKTILYVEVKEALYNEFEESDIEEGKQFDLVANKDAKIISIVTRKGKAAVEKDQDVKKGDVLVLGQNEIYDDTGAVKDILYFKADAQIYGDVIYKYVIPISELELVSLRIAGDIDENRLLHIGYQKTASYIKKLEDADVFILDQNVIVQKEERNICFLVTIYAREQIGINIPVEDVLKHESE